ncbi:unnamed protein product [Notodromas monacha]|uniref:Nucleoporin Nup54 alpha-helical domain-containing protein n=1 Tax=Notodromas monacha TaxID=399045 RepID=A0A7R9GF02_9CRUS|nr:unnamed protein product [Notodromas monacha]CAG0920171.1 unnamed protein product [Notodromas monacha]
MSGFSFGTTPAKPFGFGAAASTPSFGFGTSTTTAPTSFGFGSSAASAPSTSLFGAGSTPAFGATGTTQPFGATSAAQPAFGASTSQPFGSTNSAFGVAKPAGSAFGAFGSTATQPFGATSTGFGIGSTAPAFGAAASTAPSLNFGSGTTSGFGTGFGSAAPTASFGTSAPAFGATTTSAPAFGFGSNTGAFGSSAPTFGFGSTPATTASTFSFGTAAAKPAFGLGAPSTTSSLSSGFGASTGSTFGFGSTPSTGFGAAKPAATGFGFGATTTSAPSFGFGSTPVTTQSMFGSTTPAFGLGGAKTTGAGFGGFLSTTTTTAPSFGFGSTTTTPSFGFGSSTQGFGTGFGAKTPAASGFGFGAPTSTTSFLSNTAPSFGMGGAKPSFGFGAPSGPSFSGFGAGGTFGASQQQQQAAPGLGVSQPVTETDLSVLALTDSCKIFGDERDRILVKWNQLQAFWGHGKGFYSAHHQPVAFKPHNVFARFKAVAYFKLCGAKDSSGHVSLIINKPAREIELNQAQLQSEVMRAILGTSANLAQASIKVVIHDWKPLPNNKCEVVIYVIEKTSTGEFRRRTEVTISAKKLHERLRQQAAAQVLASSLSVEDVVYRCRLSDEQIEEYLKTPPRGIEPLTWEQGKKDNPDPANKLPQVLTGFDGLLERFRLQGIETQRQEAELDAVEQNIEEMVRKHSLLKTKADDLRIAQERFSLKVLRVLVMQEMVRKCGQGLKKEEEELLGPWISNLYAEIGAVREGDVFFKKEPGVLGDPVEAKEYFGLRARVNSIYSLSQMRPDDGFENSLRRQKLPIIHEACPDLNFALEAMSRAVLDLQTLVKTDLDALAEIRTKLDSRVQQ